MTCHMTMGLLGRRFFSALKSTCVYLFVVIALFRLMRDSVGGLASIQAESKSQKDRHEKPKNGLVVKSEDVPYHLLPVRTLPPLLSTKAVAPDTRRQVVILTYQRSGSSFLGELFNQNPGALYWFEPLDGAYAAMYGTEYGWNTPSDMRSFSNGSERVLPEEEIDFLARVVENLLRCNLGGIPTEILANNFMDMFLNQQVRLGPFVDCIKNNKVISNSAQCRKLIHNLCPKRFTPSDKRTSTCFRNLAASNVTSTGYYKLGVPSRSSAGFYKYKTCQNKVRDSILKCATHIDTACQKSQLIALKAVRLSMEVLLKVLKKNPETFIIHNIRDPRGVVLSRLETSESFWSQYAGKDMAKESMVFCREVLRDVQTGTRLESLFHGSLYRVIYEDTVVHKTAAVGQMYKFLNLEVPSSVEGWIKNNTEKYNKKKQTSRNSKQTSARWIGKMAYATVIKINKNCMELYQSLGNPWIL